MRIYAVLGHHRGLHALSSYYVGEEMVGLQSGSRAVARQARLWGQPSSQPSKGQPGVLFFAPVGGILGTYAFPEQLRAVDLGEQLCWKHTDSICNQWTGLFFMLIHEARGARLGPQTRAATLSGGAVLRRGRRPCPLGPASARPSSMPQPSHFIRACLTRSRRPSLSLEL